MHCFQFQVGRMHYADGRLKKVRGATVMLTVDPESTVDHILQCAVDKHCACDCTLPRTEYMLLYPDGQMVQHIPGSSAEVFTLQRYKTFIGKAFQKLVLYLCEVEDHAAGVVHFCNIVISYQHTVLYVYWKVHDSHIHTYIHIRLLITWHVRTHAITEVIKWYV